MAGHARMRVGDVTWGAIETAYRESDEPVSALAKRYGLAPSTIYSRARKMGWIRPAGTGVRVRATVRDLAAAPAPPPAAPHRDGSAQDTDASASAGSASPIALRREPDTPEVRIQRLFRVIDLQLDHMERHMSMGEPMTAQDQERQARAMGATLGNLERATEAAGEILKTTPRAEGDTGHGRAEAERMRREIAERLERLSERWLAQSKTE